MSDASSALYRGEVLHHRFRPVKHRFRYRIDSFLFDLDKLEQDAARCRLLSMNRFNLFSFHYRDFGAGDGRAPKDYLQQTLREHGIEEPLYRAELLCYPRILGYTFNPLSVYYCYNASNDIFAVLYEVSNTFGQRHSYLITATGEGQKEIIRQRCDKAFYVSPFIPMEATYHFRLRKPGPRLAVAIRETEDGKALLHAVFRGVRHTLNDWNLLGSFFRLPFMTASVMVAIHWQALKLYIKGMRILPRPAEPKYPVSRNDS